ncbi:hypothetical protein HMI54_008104, partial [Coelomomyces lativittatus]
KTEHPNGHFLLLDNASFVMQAIGEISPSFPWSSYVQEGQCVQVTTAQSKKYTVHKLKGYTLVFHI